MFTYVKAKNFKSLKDIEFNLNRTKTKTNQFISIYGENGSGKTNIVELFKLLQQSTMSRATDIAMNKMPKEFWKIQEEMSDQLPTEIRQIFQLSLNLKEYRMIDEEEATEIEYGFKINNKEGFYYIKFDDEIIEEKLYYTAGKQRAYLFEIKKEDNKIIKNLNKNIFINEKYNEELIDGIDKYWGKYTFLSLLSFETIEKNKEYIDNNISKNIIEVINEIWLMTVHVDKGALRIMPDGFVRVRKLNNIQNKPIVLYAKGNLKNINNESVAIVGSRMASIYGKKNSYYFSYELAKRNVNIVSGLAKGIDSYSHIGALKAKGKTIAVIGCGIDKIYPKENEKLYHEILKNDGLIISEYIVGTKPEKTNFPRRNRIISGISDAVIVVEAGAKSGSLITANYAINQGKEVWAIPGNINLANSAGTNELIKDGANVLTKLGDIIW